MTTAVLSDIAARCYRRLGLAAPGAIVADSSNTQDQQFFELCNDVGTFLMRAAVWPFLRKVCTITVTSGTATYTISTGSGNTTYTCDRIIPDVQYDTTNDWRFVGSVPDDVWYAYQYDVITEPLRKIWRVASRTTIEVFPTPTNSTGTLAIPFVTDKWAQNSGATAYQSAFAADTDTHLFDWDLFDAQVMWRFMEMKGLDYSAALKQATDKLDERVASMKNLGTLSMRPRAGRRLISGNNVPETGFGS